MADPEVLSHAFLANHPADAARVLESMAPADVAALFDRVPARLASPVLEAMRPSAAARVLPPDPARGAMLVGGMTVVAAAALLRYVGEARRKVLLNEVPTGMAIACRALLGYPEDSIGACVDPEAVALPADSRVHEALAALRDPRVKRSAPVYVVDVTRRPLGQVELPALLQAEADVRLATMLQDLPGTLPAVTPIAGALEHPVWRQADVVPVVERGGALVGVITRRALQPVHAAAAEVHDGDTFAGLVAAGYWHAVSALIEATLSLLGASARERR